MAKLDFKRAQQAQNARVKRFQQAMSEVNKQQSDLSLDLIKQVAPKCENMTAIPSVLFKTSTKFYEPDRSKFTSDQTRVCEEEFSFHVKPYSKTWCVESDNIGQDIILVTPSSDMCHSLLSFEAETPQTSYASLSHAFYFLLVLLMASQALSCLQKNSLESNAKENKPSI